MSKEQMLAWDEQIDQLLDGPINDDPDRLDQLLISRYWLKVDTRLGSTWLQIYRELIKQHDFEIAERYLKRGIPIQHEQQVADDLDTEINDNLFRLLMYELLSARVNKLQRAQSSDKYYYPADEPLNLIENQELELTPEQIVDTIATHKRLGSANADQITVMKKLYAITEQDYCQVIYDKILINESYCQDYQDILECYPEYKQQLKRFLFDSIHTYMMWCANANQTRREEGIYCLGTQKIRIDGFIRLLKYLCDVDTMVMSHLA